MQFHSDMMFFLFQLKGLYQTELYNLHVMQQVRIETT